MRSAMVIAFLAALLPGKSEAITPAEAADGWIQLFDGESLFGWTSDGPAKWKTENGVLTSDPGAAGYLRANSAFADFLLKCEFRIGAEGASGIYMRWEKHSKQEENGYKLQIDDRDANYPTGSLLDILKASSAVPRPGDWRSLEAMANADHFMIRLDGTIVLDGKDSRFRTGYIRLESRPGSRIEFRNLRLKPLDVESLFDGADLAGWKQVAPPPAKPSKLSKLIPIKAKPKPAKWAPTEGGIRVQDGPDQLETQKTFADFILQLQVRVDSKDKNHHPEGAILFRGDPGKYESGYRLLIHNDAKSPSGTLGDLQPARKAVGQDKVYSTQTIAAYGRHVSVWVDGTLVNDYEDRRPDGIARTAAGTIALAHDVDSVFDFKNINVESLPKAGAVVAEIPKPDAAKAGAGAGVPSAAGDSSASATAVPAATAMPATAATGPIQIPGQAEENARRAKVSDLTTKSLRTNDPEEQVRINTEILKLDPSNQVAYDALKSANEKIEKSKAQQAQRETVAKQQIDQSQATEAARRDGLQKAENALVAGDLKTAADRLAGVRKIAPNDPEAQVLSARVDKQLLDKRRLSYTLVGGAVAGLGALIALLLIGRGKKQAYLEIVSGTQQGKRFEFAGDVLHIGAVEQDGGSKNEIVVQDGERLISRFHCEIHRRGSKFYVFDVKSANGTFVDKRRIKPGKPVRLRKGSRVDLAGACSLRLGFDRKTKPDA